MQRMPLIKISLIIDLALYEEAKEVFTQLQAPYMLSQTARTSMLAKPAFWHREAKTKDSQSIILECYIPHELELFYMQTLIDELALLIPGRGSISSQPVTYYTAQYYHPQIETTALKKHSVEQALSTEMRAITLICARDEADTFCKNLLSNGYPSPIVYYAMGVGTRSHIGLLRITIPPEKEILTIPIYYKDAASVIELLANRARLDLPGKGFLFSYPLHYAKVNTKTHFDDPSRLASIEQLISAIDTLQGGVEWRRKNINSSSSALSRKESRLLNLTFIGARDISDFITQIAFDLGGRGATMTRKSFHPLTIEEQSLGNEALQESHDRECCHIALPEEIATKLLEHVILELDWQKIGLFSIEEFEITLSH